MWEKCIAAAQDPRKVTCLVEGENHYPLSHNTEPSCQADVQSNKYWQLLYTSCLQVSSQKDSCFGTEFCWCSQFTATFIYPPLLSLCSLFLPFLFPLVCISTLHCRLMDLESEKKNKKGGGREWDDIHKWTAQKCVCLYVGLGGLGVNGWEKCNSSIFCATITVSPFPSPLQVSSSLYSNYPDWVSWGWRDEGGKGSNRGDTVLVTA